MGRSPQLGEGRPGRSLRLRDELQDVAARLEAVAERARCLKESGSTASPAPFWMASLATFAMACSTSFC